MMDKLAAVKPTVVKMWVDDHGGAQKMKPEIYKAIITEAHKRNIRVAAHLFYLEDARALVDAGLDIIAHSIRDKEVDANLLAKMKQKNVMYIPTLSLDEYLFVYGGNPDWMNDDFFKASLEPGVYEMITNKSYGDKIRSSPDYERNMASHKIGMINLKRYLMLVLSLRSAQIPAHSRSEPKDSPSIWKCSSWSKPASRLFRSSPQAPATPPKR